MSEITLYRARDRRCYNGAFCSDMQREIDSLANAKKKLKELHPDLSVTWFPAGDFYVGFLGTRILTDDMKDQELAFNLTYERAKELLAAVVDTLGLVDVSVTESEVQSWTPEQHELAVNWAGAVYLQANDNDDVEVPECPYFVPPDETSKRLAACSKSEERQTWIVYICSHAQQAVGSMRLPDWDIPTIRRFAYQMFKDKLAKFPKFVVRCDR